MKITKIKTRAGEFGTPFSIEINDVVERMRSEETKAAAAQVARGCLYSRLAIAQGMPRYFLLDVDKLP